MRVFEKKDFRTTGISLILLVLTVSQQLTFAQANLGLGAAANTLFDPINRAVNPVFGSSVAGGLLTGATSGLAAGAGIGASANPLNGLGGLANGILGGGALGGIASNALTGTGGLAGGILGAGGVGGIAGNALTGSGSLANGILGAAGVGGIASNAINGVGGFANGILGGAGMGSMAANAANGMIANGMGTMGAMGAMAANSLGGPAAALAGSGAAATAAAATAGGSGLVNGYGFPGAAGLGGAAAAGAAAGAATGGAFGPVNGLGMANALTSAQLASGSGLGTAAATAASLAAASPVAAAADNLVEAAASEIGREQLSNDAFDNAQAEAAIAGADMTAHGANNARSASLASNAYRQAKLASARDRVNIAGTVQNSARISDAAIATHDAATKAEDSLLGSELAVDSAATVLDSDAAYIPPVTNSLLRSLPYGRLGLRNIVPKPLTYPSSLLPDVWLNGLPVNYVNSPLRSLQYGTRGSFYGGFPAGLGGWGAFAYGGFNPMPFGPTGPLPFFAGAGMGALMPFGGAGPLPFDQIQSTGEAAGYLLNGQPFWASNGWPINALVMDPTAAYLANGPMFGSSIYPILINGQMEAQDEITAANMLTMQQQNGAGMLSTYFGFGRMNPVPLLTGTVSEVNLAPTTTIGTTYPIGSALVIEPRDSYFQDYIDNASSRQNYDERQQ